MSGAGCLGCARLEQADCRTVTLLSGQVVCSWCPEWREETRDREIAARALLAMASKDNRRAHLRRLEATHGAEYCRRLEAEVLAMWERRRASVAAAGADNA